MKPTWKYLLYAGVIIAVGGLAFILMESVRAKNTGFETKTLWDWMELLIIPLVLAMGAFFLNRSERAVERRIAEDRVKEDRKLAEDRAKLDREIATDRQQEAALQAYIDRIAELLLENKLQTTEVEEVRDVARTRTVSVMRGLDSKRNNIVIQFLREANLILEENSILVHANLESVNLQGANLRGASLKSAFLPSANLEGAILMSTNLQNVYLNKANLQGAHMLMTNLLGADLQYANLVGANLVGANLGGANLEGANLEGADLEHAKISNEQLAAAKSLKGAIMPDGTKHE